MAQEWISVKDRLPNFYEDVLVCNNGIRMVADVLDCGLFEDDYGYYLYNVTHWMPLPEPPKEEE